MQKNQKAIHFQDTVLESGFWQARQKMNAETTVYAVWERFKDTGRFDAFRFDWKEGMPNKPHIFWESDFAKWAESVAYIVAKKKDAVLEKAVDDIVDLIEVHQEESGYFNIYFTVIEPEQRFQKRTEHELYDAGHLIEAAVAYHEATGKDKFLKLMMKYADYIENVFMLEKSTNFTTPGHEEIELALVKLYQATGEKRYLSLAKFFVDERGKVDKRISYDWANERYAQDHAPVRQQTTAEGHSVRAMYLYCAMADLAREYGDSELAAACATIFENVAGRRMYITGGIGSSHVGEAFTIDYDLPNLTAYTESCAAIGLMLFAGRMLQIPSETPKALFADVAERVLYNGFLSSISLNGKAFFYENPLEIHPELLKRDASVLDAFKGRLPVTERKEVFDCSCCPPNITRFIASLADMLYTCNEDTLFVHHYMAGKTKTVVNGSPCDIVQKTAYPSEGAVSFTIKGEALATVALRIPYWCTSYNIVCNGKTLEPAQVKIVNGYAYLPLDRGQENSLTLLLDMPVQLIEAAPEVQENAGRVAVQRGPVVYCLEGVDNGSLLRNVRVRKEAVFEVVSDETFGVPVLKTTGTVPKEGAENGGLYRPVTDSTKNVQLTFIPYFGFANRGESEMVLWVLPE